MLEKDYIALKAQLDAHIKSGDASDVELRVGFAEVKTQTGYLRDDVKAILLYIKSRE